MPLFKRAKTSEHPKINIAELQASFQGKPFHLLVEAHIKKSKKKENLMFTMAGTVGLLPEPARDLASGFIDRWSDASRVYDATFWHADTSEVFEAIITDARKALESFEAPVDDGTLFYMFQIVVLNYAANAIDQPAMREFMAQP